MTRKMLAYVALLYCFSAKAEIVPGPKVEEKWECVEPGKAAVLVEAYIFEGREAGRIYAAGTHYTTTYTVDGLNRRWDFGVNYTSDEKPYLFLVGVTGIGKYFDLTKGAAGNFLPDLHCESVEVPQELRENGFDNIDWDNLIDNLRE